VAYKIRSILNYVSESHDTFRYGMKLKILVHALTSSSPGEELSVTPWTWFCVGSSAGPGKLVQDNLFLWVGSRNPTLQTFTPYIIIPTELLGLPNMIPKFSSNSINLKTVSWANPFSDSDSSYGPHRIKLGCEPSAVD